MYRHMVTIRLFEEQVNDLYTRALMPGLAHLVYRRGSGRGGHLRSAAAGRLHHQHASRPRALPGERRGAWIACSPNCWARKRATARARAARCTSPIRPPATWARTPSSAAARASPQARRFRRKRWARASGGLLLRRRRAGPGRAVRSDEHGGAVEAAGDLRLRKQHVQRVHAFFGDHGGRHPGARAGLSECRRSKWTGRTCARFTPRRRSWWSARARAKVRRFCCEYVPLSRASRRRHQPRVLPRQAGRAAVEDRARSDQDPGRVADRAKGWPDRAGAGPDS